MTAAENELNKFTKLCSELECGLANSYSSLDEVLALKDVLLEQNLPGSVKVKLTLVFGKLHRSMSDLSVPTSEMTRLVRLYAVPWENKSKALKKLHQDYESKQHQLEIALRRLEIVGVQTMRMEKERRILNWEKLFAKLVGGKGHGQRWKFLIHQFKQKMKKGEDLAAVYSTFSDSDNDTADEQEINRKKSSIQFAQELRGKFDKFDKFPQPIPLEKAENKLEERPNRNSLIEEESETSIVLALSDDNSSIGHGSARLSSVQTAKKVQFENQSTKSDETEVMNKNVSVNIPTTKFLPPKREMVDKESWTHEPEYEALFHIRIFKPTCKTLSSSWCTVAFGKDVRKTQVFRDPAQAEEAEKKLLAVEEQPAKKSKDEVEGTTRKRNSRSSNGNARKQMKKDEEAFQEFTFTLPSDFESNKDEIVLKFSVHPENKKNMVAMTSVKFTDINIEDWEKIKEADEKVIVNSYPIKATINNSELIFNRPCGEIKMICYYSQIVLPKIVSRGTETLSIEELTDRIIDLRRREFVKRLKSAGTSMSEKPIYTEDQMRSAKEELKKELLDLKDEYEERLGLMISQLNKENTDDLKEFVNAATSPLFMWSSSNEVADDPPKNSFPEPVKSSRSRSPKKTPKDKQPIWGENLPEDFYERMEMFKEESFKHHQKLKEKINEQVEREIEKKLASNHRLYTPSKDGEVSEDVCLPALFMPTKTKNLYTPKARSYFHAFGSRNRLTQPPSILELPQVRPNNAEIVGIYESVMKQKMERSNDVDNDTDLGRFSPQSSIVIEGDGKILNGVLND